MGVMEKTTPDSLGIPRYIIGKNVKLYADPGERIVVDVDADVQIDSIMVHISGYLEPVPL